MNFNEHSDIAVAVKKFLTWFLPSALGVSVKLAYESRLKKLTSGHVLTSIIFACFIGWICDIACTKFNIIDFRGVIVAIGALASESLIQFYFRNDQNIIKVVILRIFNVKIEDKKDKKDNENGDNGNTDNQGAN